LSSFNHPKTMRRIIVDYKKLTPEILSLLVSKYPDGYDDDHIITFRNAKNELIEAVEVKTEDTIYLVKVSARLEVSMANFDEDDYNDDEFSEPISELPEKEAMENDPDEDSDEDDKNDLETADSNLEGEDEREGLDVEGADDDDDDDDDDYEEAED